MGDVLDFDPSKRRRLDKKKLPTAAVLGGDSLGAQTMADVIAGDMRKAILEGTDSKDQIPYKPRESMELFMAKDYGTYDDEPGDPYYDPWPELRDFAMRNGKVKARLAKDDSTDLYVREVEIRTLINEKNTVLAFMEELGVPERERDVISVKIDELWRSKDHYDCVGLVIDCGSDLKEWIFYPGDKKPHKFDNPEPLELSLRKLVHLIPGQCEVNLSPEEDNVSPMTDATKTKLGFRDYGKPVVIKLFARRKP